MDEDHVLGRITQEQFRMLSEDYNQEQKEPEDVIPIKEARIKKLNDSAMWEEEEKPRILPPISESICQTA